MGINRGKQFEDRLRKQFEKISDTLCLRLYDVTMGYSKINNPCDLIVYKDGTLNLFELKAIHGNTLNFKSHIRENQLYKLTEYSKINGVAAGIIVWFVDRDETLFIPIQYINELIDNNKKSFNINNYDVTKVIEIQGIKKRIFFNYDLDTFLNNIIT